MEMEQGTEEICGALAMHRAAGEMLGLDQREIQADERVHRLLKAGQILFSLMEGEPVSYEFVWSFVNHFEAVTEWEPGDPMSIEDLSDRKVTVLINALGGGE